MNVSQHISSDPGVVSRPSPVNPVLRGKFPRPALYPVTSNAPATEPLAREWPRNSTPESSTDYKLVLITGGSQGLGEAMGIEFAKKGADVILVARNVDKLKLAVQKVEVLLSSF